MKRKGTAIKGYRLKDGKLVKSEAGKDVSQRIRDRKKPKQRYAKGKHL